MLLKLKGIDNVLGRQHTTMSYMSKHMYDILYYENEPYGRF